MKDRNVQHPHRYQLVPVPGQPDTYDIIAKPGTITEDGTPINKATLLSDATAALYGISGDGAVPDKALAKVGNSVQVVGTTLLPFEPWASMALPSNNYWISVAYGSGKFVAIANDTNASAHSANGINWTASTLPSSGNWSVVGYGDGKFVALSENVANKAAISSNGGESWSVVTLPTGGDWRDVVYANGKFVAVSSYWQALGMYSVNGTTWTKTTMPNPGNGYYSVAYGGNKFVAVGSGQNGAYSTDGISWTSMTLPQTGLWKKVIYVDNKFIAILDAGTTVAFSIDGIDWTQKSTGHTLSSVGGMATDGIHVMVVSNGGSLYSLDFGDTWTKMANNYSGLTFGDGKFVSTPMSGNGGGYFIFKYRYKAILSDINGRIITEVEQV